MHRVDTIAEIEKPHGTLRRSPALIQSARQQLTLLRLEADDAAPAGVERRSDL